MYSLLLSIVKFILNTLHVDRRSFTATSKGFKTYLNVVHLFISTLSTQYS